MIWFVEGKLYFWDVVKKIRIRIDTTLGSPKFTKDRFFAHQKDKETASPICGCICFLE